jgi:hypothetical protein
MVASDFLSQRIAPLQSRDRPTWEYTGRSDCTRLSSDDVDSKVLEKILKFKTGLKIIEGLIRLPEGVECYYVMPEARREALRKMLAMYDIMIASHPGVQHGGVQIREQVSAPPCSDDDSSDDVPLHRRQRLKGALTRWQSDGMGGRPQSQSLQRQHPLGVGGGGG